MQQNWFQEDSGQACFINSIFVSFYLNVLIRFVCKIVGGDQTGFFVQIITLCKICAAIWILHAFLGIKLVSYGLIVIYRDYCMAGECVRFLCTSCERINNNLSQQARTNEPTMQ